MILIFATFGINAVGVYPRVGSFNKCYLIKLIHPMMLLHVHAKLQKNLDFMLGLGPIYVGNNSAVSQNKTAYSCTQS